MNFYSALLEMMPQPLLPGSVNDTTPPAQLLGGRWWAGPQGAVSLYRSANRVMLVWGTDAAMVETLGVVARKTY